MRCIIIGALPVARLPFAVTENDYVIAADKGLETAQKLSVHVDLIIGDYDSLGYVPVGENVIRLPVRKDETDVGCAVRLALERGCEDFHIFGAVGGKLDHTLANVQIAAELAAKGASVTFYGDSERFCTIRSGSVRLPARESGRVSVFSLTDRCEDVTVRGLSYECEHVALQNTFPLGVSNAFVGKSAEISVGEGTLLVVWEEGL
ncbi:MAG: thiamine diphosphokinase [Oscillospiraceae bacterium]|nr:thiamine diphosphokinase [Oscillospiraceae bacterium]